MPTPTAPSSLQVKAMCIPQAGSSVEIRLSWIGSTVSSGTYIYQLERENPGSPGTWVLFTTIAAGSTSYDFNGVNAWPQGQSEQFRLRAAGTGGNSGLNSAYVTVSFTTASREALAVNIGLPDSPAVGSIGATSATISWTDLEGSDDTAEISLTPAGGVETIYTVAGLLTSFTPTHLLPGTSYTAKLRTVAMLSGGSIIRTAWSANVVFSTTSLPATLDFPTQISTRTGVLQLFSGQLVGLTGTVTIAFQDLPPGLDLTDTGGTPYLFSVAGTPTTPGLYDSTLVVIVNGVTSTFEIRWLVSGGYFVAEFHADPQRYDLHLDLRTGSVSGQYFVVEKGLNLDFLTGAPLCVFMTDGVRWLTDATALRIDAWPSANFDSPPLLSGGPSPVLVEQFGRARGYPFLIQVDSEQLRDIFAALDFQTSGNEASRAITLDARLTYTRAAVVRRSATFKLTIRH